LAGNYGPPLVMMKARFPDREVLRAQIWDASVRMTNTRMPPYGRHRILTEKEIQLLELFLNIKKPISKNKILSSVWNYATDADTHTVETHIYRLRKKIFDKFVDEKFILNNKDGYYL